MGKITHKYLVPTYNPSNQKFGSNQAIGYGEDFDVEDLNLIVLQRNNVSM